MLASCKEKDIDASKCGDRVCTEEYATLTINIVNKDGSPARLKKNSYTVVNQRTNKPVYFPPAVDYHFENGYFFVIADNSTKDLSENGDDIKVTATDSLSNQTKTAIIKVAGGECACHIKKISGPDKIQFD
jgi:hypothetical protein